MRLLNDRSNRPASAQNLADETRRPLRRRVSGKARKVASLIAVFATAAATFVLLPPLVSHAAPTDDVSAQFEAPGGVRTLHCGFTSQQVLPDSTATCRMRVGNGTPLDGSFFLYVDAATVAVSRCPDQGTPGYMSDDFRANGECKDGKAARYFVDPSHVDYDYFVGLWELSMVSRPVVVRSLPADRDVRYDSRYIQTCAPQPLGAYDGGADPTGAPEFDRMCDMGVVRALSGPNRYTEANEPAYERQYYVGLTERDDNTDQSRFRGWAIHFDFVVKMQIPANDTCPGTRVNGVCSVPLYERI